MNNLGLNILAIKRNVSYFWNAGMNRYDELQKQNYREIKAAKSRSSGLYSRNAYSQRPSMNVRRVRR